MPRSPQRWPNEPHPLRTWTRTLRDRIDAAPIQAILTIVWAIIGIIATTTLAHTWYERMLLGVSFYALVISHWTGHLAWRAKREAQDDAS